MTGASYSMFVSDTGLASSWTFAGTILPTAGPMIGTASGRYIALVRNVNGDTVGVNEPNQLPANLNEPLYFTTPAVNETVTLSFSGDVSTNPDLQYFQADDVVQDGDIYSNYGSTEG